MQSSKAKAQSSKEVPRFKRQSSFFFLLRQKLVYRRHRPMAWWRFGLDGILPERRLRLGFLQLFLSFELCTLSLVQPATPTNMPGTGLSSIRQRDLRWA